MKAEELATQLRIGNLIKTDDGIICSIECIESKQFTEWNSGNDYSITAKEIGTKDNYLNCINDSWKPIPLSEEVLLKCGFKRIANLITGLETEIVYYQNGKIIVYLLKDFFEIEIETSSGIFNLHHTFEKHLHQLQNLYYALTGEELEVSL